MTVFARTERGQHAAYDPQSELPRKLKSILRVIDGKTTDDVYSEKLHAFGDVRGMLHSLHMAGLIQPIPSGAHHVRSNAGISDAERVVLMQPQSTDDWSATRSAYAQSGFQSTRVGPRTGPRTGPDTVALPQSSSLQAELKSARALQSATDLMGSFVLTHMPEQSFQILKELEEVKSLEMLAVLLSGYEQMISHLGEPGAQHLVHVKKILRDNL
jgi:hypothetical protein